MSIAQQWKAGHQQHNADPGNRVVCASKCLKLVKPLIEFNSVIDFGCGIGAWLHAAVLLGATKAVGVEGEWISEAETLVSKESIVICDLSAEQPKFAKEFDLAITIEVAKHLPERVADGFCQALVNASNYVLFSAAVPGQGGLGHINEQPLPYWVRKFWDRGYVPLEVIRPYIARDQQIFPWIRQNIVMFVNYDLLTRSDRLLRFARPINDFRLSYETF